MQSKIQIFENEEFGRIGVLMIEGRPYFPATECAEILGYATPRHAVSRHCRGGMKRAVIDTLGRTQQKTFIPEGDLYRLIMCSKLPSAVRFEAWVCDEVLPSIRQHGAYATPEALEQMMSSSGFTAELIRNLAKTHAKNHVLMDYVDELEPKAKYCDVILQSRHAVPVTLIAKDYGYSAVSFNKLLHALGVQYKIGNTWMLYQNYSGKGYTTTKTYQIDTKTLAVHTNWTQKGRFFLYELLKSHGILPEVERFSEAA